MMGEGRERVHRPWLCALLTQKTLAKLPRHLRIAAFYMGERRRRALIIVLSDIP
jgi:hypothetical protein